MVFFKKFIGHVLVMSGPRMSNSNQQNSRQQKPQQRHPKTFAWPPLVEDNFVCLTLSHEIVPLWESLPATKWWIPAMFNHLLLHLLYQVDYQD